LRIRTLTHECCFRRSLVASLLTCALLGAAPAVMAQEQSIILSPQITQLEMSPGARKAFEVVIGNASEVSPIVVHIGVSSITQNERGDYTVIKGDNEWSCASWMSVERTSASLAPGEWLPVKCTIQAPFTASGGRYAAVTVAFGDPGRGDAPLSASFQYMLGSYIEVTMTSGLARHNAEISNLQAVPIKGRKALEDQYGSDAFFITADVENKGNIGVIAEATLRIRQQKGLLQRDVPLGTGRGMVLPGATVKYRSLFTERPPAGIYTAEAMLDYGGYKPAVTRMVFSVTQNGEIVPGREESVETVGLGIRPARFDLRAGPGSRKTIGVTLHNVEDYPIRIAVSKLPLSQSPDGRLVARAAPGVNSCADWMEIEPDTFEVAPNMRKRLRITIKVPQDAEGSAYSRLVFNPLDTEISTEIMEEAYTTDIFLGLVPDAVEEIEVTSFQVTSEGRFQPLTCTFGIRNTGNTHVEIAATAEISSTAGPTVKELQLDERHPRILPGVRRVFTITDQGGLESGSYNVELTIRLGKKRVAYETRVFSI
jgi:hypothetical protein